MNERIETFAKAAGYDTITKAYMKALGFDPEKFAELIVRECIKCCDEIADINKVYREERLVDPEFGPKECIKTIKAHFGIE